MIIVGIQNKGYRIILNKLYSLTHLHRQFTGLHIQKAHTNQFRHFLSQSQRGSETTSHLYETLHIELRVIAVLALLSQYACCFMGFLTVQMVGNMYAKNQVPRSNGSTCFDMWPTNQLTNRTLGNIYGLFSQGNNSSFHYMSAISQLQFFAMYLNWYTPFGCVL